jgi:hypothetical protein
MHLGHWVNGGIGLVCLWILTKPLTVCGLGYRLTYFCWDSDNYNISQSCFTFSYVHLCSDPDHSTWLQAVDKSSLVLTAIQYSGVRHVWLQIKSGANVTSGAVYITSTTVQLTCSKHTNTIISNSVLCWLTYHSCLLLSNLFFVHVQGIHTYWSHTNGVDEVIYFYNNQKKHIMMVFPLSDLCNIALFSFNLVLTDIHIFHSLLVTWLLCLDELLIVYQFLWQLDVSHNLVLHLDNWKQFLFPKPSSLTSL